MNNSDMPAMPAGEICGSITSSSTLFDTYNTTTANGLTKREHFAGLAMQGLMGTSGFMPIQNARQAVEQADALLNELSK